MVDPKRHVKVNIKEMVKKLEKEKKMLEQSATTSRSALRAQFGLSARSAETPVKRPHSPPDEQTSPVKEKKKKAKKDKDVERKHRSNDKTDKGRKETRTTMEATTQSKLDSAKLPVEVEPVGPSVGSEATNSVQKEAVEAKGASSPVSKVASAEPALKAVPSSTVNSGSSHSASVEIRELWKSRYSICFPCS